MFDLLALTVGMGLERGWRTDVDVAGRAKLRLDTAATEPARLLAIGIRNAVRIGQYLVVIYRVIIAIE